MRSGVVKYGCMGKLAQQIIRWQWKLKAGLWKPFLRTWRRSGRVRCVAYCLFWGLFATPGLLLLAYKILIKEERPTDLSRFLVPVVEGVDKYLPFEEFLLWCANVSRQVINSWVWGFLLGLLALVTWIVVISMFLRFYRVSFWSVPERMGKRKEVKTEERLEALREALKPVPSKREIVSRFLTVTLVVWVGLNLAELWARRQGECLLKTNRDCSHVFLNDLIWFGLALAAGVVLILGMVDKRQKRNLAKKRVMRLRESWGMTWVRGVGAVVWAMVVVASVVGIVLWLVGKFV